MAASCAGPLAVGVMAQGAGAGAQAATNRKRHRLNQRTGHLATAVVRIAVLLIVEPPFNGRVRRELSQRLLLRVKTYSSPLLRMPPVLLCHWHIVLSRCALAEEGGVPPSFHPSRVYQPPAMARRTWYHPGSHHRGSGRSAQFSKLSPLHEG